MEEIICNRGCYQFQTDWRPPDASSETSKCMDPDCTKINFWRKKAPFQGKVAGGCGGRRRIEIPLCWLPIWSIGEFHECFLDHYGWADALSSLSRRVHSQRHSFLRPFLQARCWCLHAWQYAVQTDQRCPTKASSPLDCLRAWLMTSLSSFSAKI